MATTAEPHRQSVRIVDQDSFGLIVTGQEVVFTVRTEGTGRRPRRFLDMESEGPFTVRPTKIPVDAVQENLGPRRLK